MIDYQAVSAELITLRDWLRWTTSRFSEAGLFYGHGNADAFNEAAQLILHSLHLPVTEMPEHFLDARLTEHEKTRLAGLIRQRIEDRIPVPYLTGEAWFAGLSFFVDERVLIPRSPFAELVSAQFTPWLAAPDSVTRILDMCTGSGCIAIACAYAFPNAQVDACDISDDVLAVAAINRQQHQLDDRLGLRQSDIFSQFSDEKYDLIVSNPPYVSQAEMQTLPAEYRHEPALALESEDQGLALVARIIQGAAQHLTADGLLFVEVGNTQVEVESRWPQIGFLWLDFEFGGHGVFVLNQSQCETFVALYSDSAGAS